MNSKKAVKSVLFFLITLFVLSVIGVVACGYTKANGSVKQEASTNRPNKVIDIVRDYNAYGDGIHSDRAVIQKAIDDLSLGGGGTLVLTENHTFLTGNLLLRSNVTILFGDNAVVAQNPDVNDYIEARGYDYGNGFVEIGEPFVPYNDDVVLNDSGIYADIWPTIPEFKEAFHWNYPLFYADKGTSNIRIIGEQNARIDMAPHGSTCKGNIHLNTFGFYRVTDFEINNITTNFTGGHFMDIICCNNGVIANITMATKRSVGISECEMNDGLHLDRCQDVLIENCFFASGDDSFKVGNSYGDVRRDRWASSTDVQPMLNIEISHCSCPSLCSGFSFMSIAGTCPDLEQVEMRNIYIHDCNFAGVKVWGQNTVWIPDRSMWNGISIPVSNLRWENNNVHYSPEGYVNQLAPYGITWVEPISDCISDDETMHSTDKLFNTDFANGRSYWNFTTTGNSISIAERYNNESYGFIGSLEQGETKLYQGLYLKAAKYRVSFKVKTSSNADVYLFVSDQNNNVVAKVAVNCNTWDYKTLEFEIDKTDNYRIGIMSGNKCGSGSWAMIDDFSLTNR